MSDVKCAYIQIQVKGDEDAVYDALSAIQRFCQRDRRVRPLLEGTHCEDVELDTPTPGGPHA